jgi:hypothetical protein
VKIGHNVRRIEQHDQVLRQISQRVHCELPVCLCVIGISVVFPSGDFLDEGLFVWDAAFETLSGEDTEFGFREIEPTAVLRRVVPFEALDSFLCGSALANARVSPRSTAPHTSLPKCPIPPCPPPSPNRDRSESSYYFQIS